MSFVCTLTAIWGRVFFSTDESRPGRGEATFEACIVITHCLAVPVCRTGLWPVSLVEGMSTSREVNLAQCYCVQKY
jgi:hypothetical protein